jgi:cysteine desulfurase
MGEASPPVYLDNNATTALDPAVLAAMMPYLTTQFGNASARHGFGAAAAEGVTAARSAVAALIGAAHDREIVFTSGGTEANNAALLSGVAACAGRDEVIVSVVEHAAVLHVCERLARQRGVIVHHIGVDGRGRLDMEAYRAALGPRTAVVSIMSANNETGTLFDVAGLAVMAHAAGALFHTDAVQAVGKLAIDVKATAIDMLSLSAHKFHGPKGVGALYVRKGVPFQPLIAGGRQERGRRGGTENVPGIVGLGQAAALALLRMGEDLPRISALRDRLERGILGAVPDCVVAGDLRNRLANTCTVLFDRAEAEPILTLLDQAGIAASAGSACNAGAMRPSHVLVAMRVAFTAAHGALRFSLSRSTSAEEVERLLEVPAAVRYARSVSLFAPVSGEGISDYERVDA